MSKSVLILVFIAMVGIIGVLLSTSENVQQNLKALRTRHSIWGDSCRKVDSLCQIKF